MRARGVSTTGWPGHLGCRVGVSVRVSGKSHGSARLAAVSVGVGVSALYGGVEGSEGRVSSEANESPVEVVDWKARAAVSTVMNWNKTVFECECVQRCSVRSASEGGLE